MQSAQYALRVDYTAALHDVLLSYLGKHADSYFFVLEGEGTTNPHVHGIFASSKKLAALRKAFQRDFSMSGNSQYSLKQCQPDVSGYMRYMCKGISRDVGPVIWGYSGLVYGRAAIDDWHSAYWVNNAVLRENVNKRQKLEDRGNMVEQLEAQAKLLGYNGHDRMEIANLYISLYVDARKPISVFHAKSVVNTVCIALDAAGTSARHEVARAIADI